MVVWNGFEVNRNNLYSKNFGHQYQCAHLPENDLEGWQSTKLAYHLTWVRSRY